MFAALKKKNELPGRRNAEHFYLTFRVTSHWFEDFDNKADFDSDFEEVSSTHFSEGVSEETNRPLKKGL